MEQQALDERFTLPVVLSQIICWHTPRSANAICPRDDESTHSIRSIKHVIIIITDPHVLISPMIVTMQKWFTIFDLLIQDYQYLAVQPLREGYASSQF